MLRMMCTYVWRRGSWPRRRAGLIRVHLVADTLTAGDWLLCAGEKMDVALCNRMVVVQFVLVSVCANKCVCRR